MTTRRNFLIGLGAVVATPAVARASSLDMIRGKRLLLADEFIYVVHDGDRLWEWGIGELIAPPNGTIKRPFRTIKAAMDHITDKIDANGHRCDVNLGSGIYRGTFDLPDHSRLFVTAANHVILDDVKVNCFSERSIDNPIITVLRNSSAEWRGCYRVAEKCK